MAEVQKFAAKEPISEVTPFLFDQSRADQRATAMEFSKQTILASSAPAKILYKINDIPIIKKGVLSADLIGFGREEWIALKRNEEFVVTHRKTGGGKDEYLVEGRRKELDDTKVKERLEAYAADGITVKAVYITTKPYDCTTFVNSALTKSGAQPLNYNAGNDAAKAMKISGAMRMQSIDELADAKKGPQIARAFFQTANEGDVVLFLVPLVKGLEKLYEKDTGDKIIWIDKKPYAAHHAGLFSGKNEKNEPMISQAHIREGSIERESAVDYTRSNIRYFSYVAIISYDYFANKESPVKIPVKLAKN